MNAPPGTDWKLLLCPGRDGAKDALAARERSDHAPEQNGLGELHEPDSDGSLCERDGEPLFSREQTDRALVESEEVHIGAPHAAAGPRCAAMAGRSVAVSLLEQRGEREGGRDNDGRVFGDLRIGLVDVDVDARGALFLDQRRDIGPALRLQSDAGF